ncbi:hypothetical protein M9H77_23374 [Catharanthus roseus]|uniref:Uncharacterized protein n=1 Tax=Catharanthus roseus TaxID=4058 RepID=A0ACC0AX63_CATRO|nr:hypothetical protein M9H77_23374 [Catharanthus roseus]
MSLFDVILGVKHVFKVSLVFYTYILVCIPFSIYSRSSTLCVWGSELKLQILNIGTTNQEGDLGRDLDPILQAQEDSYQLVLFLFLCLNCRFNHVHGWSYAYSISSRRGSRRGGLGGRGYHRPQEEYPRQEAWHDDNFYKDDGDNSNVGQAYYGGYHGNQQGDKALEKTKWKLPSFKGDSDPNVP